MSDFLKCIGSHWCIKKVVRDFLKTLFFSSVDSQWHTKHYLYDYWYILSYNGPIAIRLGNIICTGLMFLNLCILYIYFYLFVSLKTRVWKLDSRFGPEKYLMSTRDNNINLHGTRPHLAEYRGGNDTIAGGENVKKNPEFAVFLHHRDRRRERCHSSITLQNVM